MHTCPSFCPHTPLDSHYSFFSPFYHHVFRTPVNTSIISNSISNPQNFFCMSSLKQWYLTCKYLPSYILTRNENHGQLHFSSVSFLDMIVLSPLTLSLMKNGTFFPLSSSTIPCLLQIYHCQANRLSRKSFWPISAPVEYIQLGELANTTVHRENMGHAAETQAWRAPPGSSTLPGQHSGIW